MMRNRIHPYYTIEGNCNYCKHFVQWESRCYRRGKSNGIWMDTEAETKCKYHEIGFRLEQDPETFVHYWIKIDENGNDI